MDLHTLLLTKNACYAAGAKLTPTGIMVHSTGSNNPYLKRYLGPDDGLIGANPGNHWNQPKPDGREVCVHAFIGRLADGSVAVYQSLPWNMKGWHAGGKANDSHIGFEICEDGLDDRDYFEKVYRQAAELCAYLCGTYNIRPEKPFLICHCEGYALGLASNHADVMHWFPKFGKSMDTFRADVKAALAGGAPGAAEYAKAEAAPSGDARVNVAPEEAAVEKAAASGMITDRQYWLNVLAGKTTADGRFIKLMFENAAKKAAIAADAAGKTPEEAAVDGAVALGLVTDRRYWLDVLSGKTAADRKYIQIIMENAGKNI